MRIVLLFLFALGLLTFEGALCRLLHLDTLRPDLILILTVWIALRPVPGAVVLVFALGLMADSFGGTPAGLLTLIYLLVWSLIRAVRSFLLPDRALVQIGMLFVMSLASNLILSLLFLLFQGPGDLGGRMFLWVLPLAVANVLLASPVWAVQKIILEPTMTATLARPV